LELANYSHTQGKKPRSMTNKQVYTRFWHLSYYQHATVAKNFSP
jgi:hypothetical protein